jgi:hypothetical protein
MRPILRVCKDHVDGMQLRLDAIRDKVDPLVWEELHALSITLANMMQAIHEVDAMPSEHPMAGANLEAGKPGC